MTPRFSDILELSLISFFFFLCLEASEVGGYTPWLIWSAYLSLLLIIKTVVVYNRWPFMIPGGRLHIKKHAQNYSRPPGILGGCL